MNMLSRKKLAILISLAFASHAAYAEPPAPPPVQSQEGTASREGGARTYPLVPLPPSPVTQPFDPLKVRPRLEPTFAEMVGIPYGSFLLFPEVVLYETYDSNIYAQPRNTSSDWVTTLSPSLVVKSNWEQHGLDFNIGANLDRYNKHSQENVDDYWLGFNGHYDIAPGINVFGGLRHSRDHEDRGSPDAVPGLEPTVFDTTEAHLGVAAQFGPTSVRAGATHEQLNFHNPLGAVSPDTTDDRDRKMESVGARVGYAVSPTLEPFIQAASDARRYNQSPDDTGYRRNSDGYRVAIGASYKPTAMLQGEAFVGHMHQDYDDSRFADLNRPYFGATLNWKPLAGTSISAFLDRSLEETTLTGASGFVDTTAGVNVERALSRDLLVNGGVAQTQSSYLGINREDNITDASVGVKYYISPVVFLGADYRLLNRDSNVQDAHYLRNQVMFSVGYTPGRKRSAPESSLASLSPMEKALAADAQKAELHGSITPKLTYFDYTQGVGQNSTQFLERYNYLDQSFGNNRRDGVIADIDLNLVYSGAERDFLVLEREGYGENNQHTKLKADSDSIQFKAYNSIYQSATGGIDYRYNPNAVAGGTDPNYSATAGNTGESQHVSKFNFDSPDTLYTVTRNNNGASMLFKPAAFAGNGSVEVSYDSTARNGNKMTNYVFPSASLSGGAGPTASELAQWRGYSQPIDEQSKRFAVNLALTPKDMFQLNYEFSIDAFQNNTSPVTIATISQWSGIQVGPGGGAVPFFNTAVAAGQSNIPLNFVADSTLITNSLRFSKQFSDSTVLSAGLSMARLEQDSFTAIQQTAGYNDGKTGTDSGYLTGRFNIGDTASLEAFARYNKRQNDSTYPVAGFYDPVSSTSYERMVMPRINQIETKTYGLEAHLYPSILKTSWTAGWTHEDKERDLTYGTDPALVPQLMLYRASSSSDEVYLKLISRPAQGWTIRVTPSYLWSNETGLVTEPEEAVQLKTMLTYAKPEWNELLVSAYYNYKDKKNGLLGYSNYDQYTGFSAPQSQKVNSTLQSAGLNFSLVPREALKVNLGYAWNQMDFDAYYFSTNRVRSHYLNPPGGGSAPPPAGYTLWPLDFLVLSQPNFKVDSHTLSAGAEWQWSDKTALSGAYSLNWSKGNNASGLTAPLPDVDNRVDNQLHSLSLGLEYTWTEQMSIRGMYTYDYYKDRVYQEMSGKLHTLMLGLNYRL